MGADHPDRYVARFSSDPPRHPELAWWAVRGNTIKVVRGMGFSTEEYSLRIHGDTLVGRGAEMTDDMWYAAFAVQGHRAACVRPNGQAI